MTLWVRKMEQMEHSWNDVVVALVGFTKRWEGKLFGHWKCSSVNLEVWSNGGGFIKVDFIASSDDFPNPEMAFAKTIFEDKNERRIAEFNNCEELIAYLSGKNEVNWEGIDFNV